MRLLSISLFIVWSWIVPTYAVTATLEVYFLPLHEAAEAVKTQLSNQGKVVEIHASHLLLLEDKAAYIKKAKALLKRLDKPVAQLTVHVEIEDSLSLQQNSMAAEVAMTPLSGGWVQLRAGQHMEHVAHRGQYQLRVTETKPARIEIGQMHAFNKRSQRWLSGYGLIEENSVEYIALSTGFFVRARLVGKDLVHVRIVPWMKRADEDSLDENQAALIGLGKNVTPAIPDSYLRYKAQKDPKPVHEVRIAGAATELTISLDKTVSIAAVSQEAENLANVLLGRYSSFGKRQFVIRLKVSH